MEGKQLNLNPQTAEGSEAPKVCPDVAGRDVGELPVASIDVKPEHLAMRRRLTRVDL